MSPAKRQRYPLLSLIHISARGILTMNAEAFAAVQSGTVKKGDVLGVARIAGIMAAKRTRCV